MPLILTQYSHDAIDRNRYLDREGLIYHFPQKYLAIVRASIDELGDRRFIYQRPTREAPEGQGGTYFGYGLVGDPYMDSASPGHYFIDILHYTAMRAPVRLKDAFGNYFETGETKRVNFQGRSVRFVDAQRYHNILASDGAYSPFQAPVLVQDLGVYAPGIAPTDTFRTMDVVPPGTGYVPGPGKFLDPFEAASLHERARKDHQDTLALVVDRVKGLGGTCFYNNNVDLFAQIGERRMLVEAKSLTRQTQAVNRMRYGMGQLMDYGVRYRGELRGAQPVLAFGTPPDPAVGWIPSILQGNNIAFITNVNGRLVAGNELGEALPLFE